MGNPVVITKTLAASSANNICLSQTPVSGTALTLNGSTVTAGVATLDTARRVLLTFGVEASQRTLVVTGTNETGNPIQETLTVASGGGSTVATLQDYLTVTSLLPAGGGWSAAVTVGTNTVGSSPWKLIDPHVTPINLGLNVNITSGAINYSIEHTYDALPGMLGNTGNLPWSYPTAPQVLQHPVLTSLAVSAEGIYAPPGPIPRAWRFTINSGTGTATATGDQAGIA